MKKKLIGVGIVFTVIVAVMVWYVIGRRSQKEIFFDTAGVSVGTIRNSVTATGTVEPLDKVEVGTQVSGVLEKLYVDFNSTVKKGQLIAEVDKKNLNNSVELSKVALNSAMTELEFQHKNHERRKSLFDLQLISREEFDQSLYSFEKAQIEVQKAKAELKRTRENLGYANIYSPIDGIVLSRAVEKGQTVAASLNAPTLFIIAHDLTKMKVQADVDEADIGQIQKEQRVTFTVDAHPEEIFEGQVTQIWLEPKVTSNVVTYTVIIVAENPGRKLMPGMTATIAIYTREVIDVITMPARALRFKPDPEMMQAYRAKMETKSKDQGKLPVKNARQRPEKSKDEEAYTKVWLKKGEKIRPVKIRTGISDATTVEVHEGLKVGDKVVISMAWKNTKMQNKTGENPEVNNPFVPRRRRH